MTGAMPDGDVRMEAREARQTPRGDNTKSLFSCHDYERLRDRVAADGFADEIEWAQTVGPPGDAFDLWCEYGWVICNSGMRFTVAKNIWARILRSIADGNTAAHVFGHEGKAAAIDSFFAAREAKHGEFMALDTDEARLAWCAEQPWIGKITRYHLAKNLGVDCAKPDRWLERVAASTGETVDELCRRIAENTGDRVATVDLVIWRACERGIYVPETA